MVISPVASPLKQTFQQKIKPKYLNGFFEVESPKGNEFEILSTNMNSAGSLTRYEECE